MSLLALLALLLFVVIELGQEARADRPFRFWQGAVLRAASTWGVVLVVITEGLSAVHAIRRAPLTVVWAIAVFAALVLGWRRGLLRKGGQWLGEQLRGLGKEDIWPSVSLAALGVLVVLVAFAAVPNNVDALQYHMPRVLEWAQSGDLRHFATPYDSQNSRPYWAELAILNLRVMWGGDRPANLPQAFSLIGIVVAASGICGLLGGDRRSQWLAAALAFSVPMGLLQATTPKNDVVSAFWVLSTAYFVVLGSRRELTAKERWALFSAVGLAILTKGTTMPFVVPFVVWYSVRVLAAKGFRQATVEGVSCLAVIVVLNGAFWQRNIVTYGGPYGSTIPVEVADLRTGTLTMAEGSPPRSGGTTGSWEGFEVGGRGELRGVRLSSSIGLIGPLREFLFKIVRMLGLHFVTPVKVVNDAVVSTMELAPEVFPEVYVESLRLAAWNHEMTAGNPAHLALIVFAIAAVGVAGKDWGGGYLLWLSLAAMAGFFLISFSECSDSMFCMRYQLAFFYLAAPLVAVAISRLRSGGVKVATALALAYSVPYLLFNNMRPVVGATPWPTRIESIFTAGPAEVLFAQSPEIRDEYEYVAQRIRGEACHDVGLATTRYDLEYTLWRLLAAPESGVSLHHIRGSPETAKYVDPRFDPCAIICTVCEGLSPPADLVLDGDFGHVRLYLRRSD